MTNAQQLKSVKCLFLKSQNIAVIKNSEPNPCVVYMTTGWIKLIFSNLKFQCFLVCFSCLELMEKKEQFPFSNSVLLLVEFIVAEREYDSGSSVFLYCFQ